MAAREVKKGCDPENRIKSLRKMTGLSQTKFGEKYGIPMRTIQNWEGGCSEAPEYVINLLDRAVKGDLEG